MRPVPGAAGGRRAVGGAVRAAQAEAAAEAGQHVYRYRALEVDTGTGGDRGAAPRQEISLHDLTGQVRALVAEAGVAEGTVNLVSQHTTVGLTINENEARLKRDYARWLRATAPPDAAASFGVAGAVQGYEHNDLAARPETPEDLAAIDRNWMSQGKGTLEEFMAQEPINAHAHLMTSVLGTTLSIPVSDGALCIGQWQSVLAVECDGPRVRSIGCQVQGYVT